MPTVTRLPAPTRQRHPNRHPRTREEAWGWLAAQFTHITPEEMRAAELTFGPATPVADRMAARPWT